MRAEIYLIPNLPFGRLAIMPRPRAGDWLADEITSWQRDGLDIVVSLLEPSEVIELGLENECSLCTGAGLTFLEFPIPDRGMPESAEALRNLVAGLVQKLRNGQGVGVHCRMGLGRSALVAACVLVSLGFEIEEAWRALEAARRLSVPDTREQRDWVSRNR